MKKQTFRIAAILVIVALLAIPAQLFAKPSVSSGNYSPQQSPPPAQPATTYQQGQAYGTNAGSEMMTGTPPGVTPPVLPPPAAVPEPITLVLFGLGLAGAGVAQRFRKRSE